MTHRHLTRSVIVSVLYSLDVYPRETTEQINELIDYVVEEFTTGSPDRQMVEQSVFGLIKKKVIIDDILNKATSNWYVSTMFTVDRNILRMCVYEMIFDRATVHPKISISESVELALRYGWQSNRKFVNGVLGSVYRELAATDPSIETRRVAYQNRHAGDEFPTEEKVSALVYSVKDNVVHMALVHDVWGYWTLPKGGAAEGEDTFTTCIREVSSEIGISITPTHILGENTYPTKHPEFGTIYKHTTYCLAHADHQKLFLVTSGGLDDAQWFPMDTVVDLRMYNDVVQMILKASVIIPSEIKSQIEQLQAESTDSFYQSSDLLA